MFRCHSRRTSRRNHSSVVASFESVSSEVLETRVLLAAPQDLAFNFSGTTVNATWTAEPDAQSYDIWINNLTTNVSQFVRNQNLQTNSYSGTFTTGSFKTWVRAKMANGSYTDWSEPAAFTIDGLVRVIAPTGEFKDESFAEKFSWSKYKGSAGYQLWVTNTTTNQRVIYEQNLPATQTNYTASFNLPPSSYRAWVRPKFGDKLGAWSPVSNFKITPREITITGGTTGPQGATFNRIPTITWEAAPISMEYDLTIVSISTQQVAYSRTNLAGTSHTLATPLKQDLYRVTVIGHNSALNLQTPPQPSQIDLVIGFVGGGSAGASYAGNRVLNVAGVPGVMLFDVYVETVDGPGQNPVFRDSSAPGPTVTLPNSLPAAKYRVWTRGIHVESGYSFYTSWTLIPVYFSITSLTQPSHQNPAALSLGLDRLPSEVLVLADVATAEEQLPEVDLSTVLRGAEDQPALESKSYQNMGPQRSADVVREKLMISEVQAFSQLEADEPVIDSFLLALI